MSIDAQALRKKIGRTCDEAKRALLGSLLLYVSDRADGPRRAENGEHRAGCPPQPQEAGVRPTRFQLLQAKFMGTGREHLKRTREVGRLISKDRQGPGRSLVSTAINKLLERTKEGASSPGQKPLASEKPRWGPPGGKSPVKTILKKFLAAEEKEAKEKEARKQPFAPRPGAARGPLPRIGGRSSILSKLREKFEQSSCLHSEAGLLPLHREGRKSLQRKKVLRPQVRVLHTATMATSCTRTPPARFLACTAEPLPALSIATIVCSPRSWLSHCAKISHLGSKCRPRGETTVSPNSGNMESGRKKPPETGPLDGVPRGQPMPSGSSMPQAGAPKDSGRALSVERKPQADSTHCEAQALPSQELTTASLGLASPRAPRSAGGDRTVAPGAQATVVHTQGAEEGTGEAPEITMTVCSSEDEGERAPPDLEREPLFAIQGHLPGQATVARIPPLAPPAVQAERRAQPAIESPKITVQRPIVHEMPAPPGPLQRSHGDKCAGGYDGENVVESVRAALPTMPEGRGGHPAPPRPSRPCGKAMSPGAVAEPGSWEDRRDAAGLGRDIPQTVPTPETLDSAPPGQGSRLGCKNGSGDPRERPSQLSHEKPPLPASRETSAPDSSVPARHPATPQSPPGWGACSTSGSQRGPRLAVLVPSQGGKRSESSAETDMSVPWGQEESKSSLVELAVPLRTSQENTSQDLGDSSLDGRPKASVRASGGATAVGRVTSPKIPQPGSAQDPGKKPTPQPGGAPKPDNTLAPWPGGTWVHEDKVTLRTGVTQSLTNRQPWPGGAQGPEDKLAPRPSGTHSPDDKVTPQPGGTRDPEDQLTPQPGAAQGRKDKMAEESAALDEQEDRASSTRRCVAKGNGLIGEGLPQEPSNYRLLSPGRSSEHRNGATEGGVFEDRARRQPRAWAAATARPREAADSGLVPAEPQLCVSEEAAARESSGARGHRVTATEGDSLRSSRASPSLQRGPAGSPGHGLSPLQLPSVVGQAEAGGRLEPERPPPPGAPLTPTHPTGPAVGQEVGQPGRAQGPDPPATGQWAGNRAAPHPKSSGSRAGESRPAQEGVGRPESHLRLEEADQGSVRLWEAGESHGSAQSGAGPSGQKAVLRAADSQAWAPQDLRGQEEASAVESPGQYRARDQAQPQGLHRRQVRGPAQGVVPEAREDLAALGNPEKPGTVAVQSQARGPGRASRTAAQAWELPNSTAGGAPAASTGGGPPKAASTEGSQGHPGAHPPPRGTQPPVGTSTTAGPLQPAGGSAWPMPHAGGCQTPHALAQEEPPSPPGTESDLSDHEHRRRLVHLAKYKAQSFSNQRAFDLSFRPTVLKASDTFEPPK